MTTKQAAKLRRLLYNYSSWLELYVWRGSQTAEGMADIEYRFARAKKALYKFIREVTIR